MKVDSIHEGGPKKGDIVYRWAAPTYGVLGAREVAVTFQPDETPFYSVERGDLEGARFSKFVGYYDDPSTSIIEVKWVPYE